VVSAFRGHPPAQAAECGTILPFSFRPDLELVADPAVLANEEIFFNDAHLERSMALNTADWTAVAKPRVERIALGPPAHPAPEVSIGPSSAR